jgi:predicted ATPase
LPRHQTLSAMLDWSYNLLPESERMVLRRLSVFVGAFSLEAAQFVAAEDTFASEQVPEAIAGLVTKSLIAVETNHTGVLYRLLDMTRAYALAKLVDSGERNTTAQRHAIYYREFLECVEVASFACPKRNGAIESWRHVNNARAALEWSFSEPGDEELGTALAAVSAPLFLELSLLTECRFWMERAIGELDVRGDRREMELQEALAVSLMFIKGNKSAVVELTGLRTPCGLIDRFQRGLKRKMVRSQMGLPKFRCGVLGIVVVGGKIRQGDAIRADAPSQPCSALPAL